jgi:hypothetical protein
MKGRDIMPTENELESLRATAGTIGQRLAHSVGRPVVIYLTGVCADFSYVEPAPPGACPPPDRFPTTPGGGTTTGGTPIIPGFPGTGDVGPIGPFALGWECPEEMPPPMMITAVVTGTLIYLGTDFLSLQALIDGSCVEILIPYSAIGIIITGEMLMG